MDAHNSPGYYKENLEGVLERPIEKKIFFIFGLTIIFVLSVFSARLAYLQLIYGSEFKKRSENNYLRIVEQYPERGLIYDREGLALAANKPIEYSGASDMYFSSSSAFSLIRRYPENGFLHLLGFLQKNGNILRGASGIELAYDDVMRGHPKQNIEEIDANGEVFGYGVRSFLTEGFDVKTSISRGLQFQLSEFIEKIAKNRGFSGGAAIVMDVSNGNVLAIVSYPEFNPNLLVMGVTEQEFNKILNDSGKPFFNRALSGLYPPGSIIKPIIAAAALAENIINPAKIIITDGKLILPNPYAPDKPNVFLDWKNHGPVDMKKAIAVSSNVYFYSIGGGYGAQRGLGIETINKYLRLFGFEQKTGIDIPGEQNGLLPDTRKIVNGRAWSIGDTYHASIGQGDILVTPIQMAVYATAIASNGTIFKPQIMDSIVDSNKHVIKKNNSKIKQTSVLDKKIFDVVKDGMRLAVTEGTAQGLSGFPFSVAAKTGTAEIGKTGKVHSWSIGFAPYENPKIAFAIIMENGQASNLVGATAVAAEMFAWMSDTKFLDTIGRLEN